MALLDRKSVLSKALAGAATLGLAAGVAHAQDQTQQAVVTDAAPVATTQVAATTSSVQLLPDASRAAGEWSMENDGLAVAVFLGTESKVTPTQIEQVLTREIQSAGVRDVTFFYEQNDVPATGVTYAYFGGMDGPFHLGEARDAAKKSAQQYLFQQRSVDLALNR